jgi:hypothetical protein
MLYDRQEYDTNEGWTAFKIYRDLGAARTLRGVARLLVEKLPETSIRTGKEAENNKLNSLIRWNKECNWQNRADAYDDDISTMAYKSLAKMEKSRLTATVEDLRERLTLASVQAHEFSALSMSISIAEMNKVKDQSDNTDEVSQSLAMTHLNIVKTVKEATEIIEKSVGWIDRAYSLTSLIELANRQAEGEVIDV